MKHLNVPFDDETYQELTDVKGDRSWAEAIREEFGIED
jgi:predicted CopG family antitoxin